MTSIFLSSLFAVLIGVGDSAIPALDQQEPSEAPLRLAEPGGVIHDAGQSRRPRAELPAMAAPDHASSSQSGHASPRSGERGESAEGSRDLGEHRPGELYLVPGEHRPGDLDRQGTFRPGDLG